MKPILKWQYEQLIKELLLLQDHEADPSCPCDTAGERCVRKHLFTIEAYAHETIPIEDNPEYKEKLQILTAEAKKNWEKEEEALCGKPSEKPQVLEWSRLAKGIRRIQHGLRKQTTRRRKIEIHEIHQFFLLRF